MNAESVTPRRKRRTPKPGCFFHGLLILGYIFLGFGGFTILGGLTGLIYTSIKTAPDIFSAPQYLDQPFTFFVLSLFAGYFAVFAGLGCAGLLVIGLGFLFIFISTEPIGDQPLDKPSLTAKNFPQ